MCIGEPVSNNRLQCLPCKTTTNQAIADSKGNTSKRNKEEL